MKRAFAVIASIPLAASLAAASPEPLHAGVAAAGPATRPNVLVILVDDATVHDVASMENVGRLLADEGTTFARAYSADPICCPARATILTGLYPHNHRVLDNVAPLGGFTAFDDSSTLATWLDPQYRTGLFGKYLNDNASQRSYIPPGWDDYKVPVRDDTYLYESPQMWVNGSLRSFPGQQSTRLYARQARAFMSRAVKAGQPFFGYLAIVTPHAGAPHDDYPDDPGSSPWVPPEYRDTEPRSLPDDPAILEADVTNKPSYVLDQPALTKEDLALIAERDAQHREALKAVDDEVASIVERLDGLGVLDDTYIVLASDNGFMNGQHRIKRGKAVAYEPAARVPLIIRGPGFPAGATYDRVAGLQDIAPTVLDVADLRPTVPVDGLSLLRLVDGSVRSARPQLIEIPVTAKLSDNAVQRGARPVPAEARRLRALEWHARGLVTSSTWKYVEYPQTGETELYDLRADPFELENLADEPEQHARAERMAERLKSWRACSGPSCR